MIEVPIEPGEPVKLDSKDLEALGKRLVELTGDLEAQHAPFIRNVEVWWEWYEGRPAVERRSDPWDGAPLARDTEVLTKTGWRRVDELTIGEIALTRRDADGSLEWQPILGTVRVWADSLIWFRSKSFDQQVTDKHQMIVVDRAGKNPQRLSASEVWSKTNLKLPMTGTYQGTSPETLFGLPSGDVMELLGWYISEGWSNKVNGVPKGTLFIGQSRFANPEKCDRIEALLGRLGISWVRAKSNECYCLHVRSMPHELAKELRSQGQAHQKRLPRWVFDLHPALLTRLLESLVLGDGGVRQEAHQNLPVVSYFTTSKGLADDVQVLAALIGKHGRVSVRDRRGTPSGTGFGVARHISYQVTIRNKTLAKYDAAKYGRVEYNDHAYCVTVPNHAIYVRRDGKPSWTGNSNIIIPVIQYHADALKARLQNTIFAAAPEIVVGRTKNPTLREVARSSADFFNYAADDNEFDFRTPSIHFIDEAVIVGRSIKYQKWASRQRYVFSPSTGKPQLVELGAGPVYEHVPAESILWAINRPLSESEVIIRQSNKTRSELILMRATDQLPLLDDDDFDRLLNQVTDAGYTANIQRSKALASGLIYDERYAPYDIRQAEVDWPMLRGAVEDPKSSDPKSRSLPLVVTFERNSGLVCRVITKPFLTRGNTYYEGSFRTAAGHRSAGGVAKRLEHIQRAASTIVNQSIDVVTLANSVPFLTSDRDFANRRLSLGRPQFVGNLAEVREVQLQKIIQPELALLNTLFIIGERVTGINDPLLGRETRMGGHPSPASSTAMLLQESREMLRSTLNNLRFQYGRMAEDTLTLYQQYEAKDSGMIERAMGGESGALLKQFLFPIGPVSAQMSFDLKAVSENLNQEQEFQQAIACQQVVMSYYSQILNITSAVEKGQLSGKLTGPAAIRAIEALTQSSIRILEAARVDDPREFVLKVRESNADPRAIQDFGQFATGQLQQLAANNPGVRPPIVPAGPGGLQMAVAGGIGPSQF